MGAPAMRNLIIAAVAALLMLPATRQANACEGDVYAAEAQAPVFSDAQAASQEFSAEEKKMDAKKPMKAKAAKKVSKKKKMAKKHTKKKKEKVEYMRAAPMK
jgi:hypothetical protein